MRDPLKDAPCLSPALQSHRESTASLRDDVTVTGSKCIHDLFDEQVIRTPNRTAAICRDGALTYRALQDKANQLADHLKALGVGPEVIVGISMERSLEMLVALLGVLKAGGAYLPLDPGFPTNRLLFMLEDSSTSVVLTQQNLADRFVNSKAKTLVLEQPVPFDTLPETVDKPICKVAASSLAYLMYTSGSTGMPKGVMVEHRNVVNFFAGMDRVLGSGRGVWLAVTSISFDISVLELVWTLTHGFTVVIQPGADCLAETGRFSTAAQLRRHRVTHLQCTPTLARALIRSPETLQAMKTLKHFLLGGEVLPLSLAQHLSTVLTADLYNLYGPTETTIWSTAQKLHRPVTSIRIGEALANTTLYVIEETDGLARTGITGELYIGGAGVARGYWRRPELDAEKFVANPFLPDAHQILYRTGDLIRTSDDGGLEFLGRTDRQVKIRGFRIELGEVEAVLNTHVAVLEAAVATHPGFVDEQQLVAYVVTKPDTFVNPEELKRHMRQALPEYMVPSLIVLLDAMPRTPNGKLDHSSLPDPSAAVPKTSQPSAFARTEFERIIAEAWQDALGVERVALDVNLFDCGATSLSVAEVAMHLRERLKRDISVTDLFAYPTVSLLASHLAHTDAGSSPSTNHSSEDFPSPPLLTRVRTNGPIFSHRGVNGDDG